MVCLERKKIDFFLNNRLFFLISIFFSGWYHGERLRDGVQGWFPGNYTEEVASPHVRAKNLKQRHRLLVFSANYLESQKKSP